jgi:hypothetical protein
MVKKNFWETMKSGFKEKARKSRKDFGKHTKIGKGSIDSAMAEKLKAKGKI